MSEFSFAFEISDIIHDNAKDSTKSISSCFLAENTLQIDNIALPLVSLVKNSHVKLLSYYWYQFKFVKNSFEDRHAYYGQFESHCRVDFFPVKPSKDWKDHSI